MAQVTRRIEFDAGHRIPDHKSKCRNIHGHRYVLEATFEADLKTEGSETGMVADFSDLKAIMMEAVGEPWDHAFLCFKGDKLMQSALACLPSEHKTVMLPFVPTVENLARKAYDLIMVRVHWSGRGLNLVSLRLWETPNCSASYPELEG